MRDFKYLKNLCNNFDFTQLRALDNKRATDTAIFNFVNSFNSFFEQFNEKPPTYFELIKFKKILSDIIDKINIMEIDFFSKKYSFDDENNEIDLSNFKITFDKLTTRMQYWAAGESFGDAIRNSERHHAAVKFLDKWNNDYLNKLNRFHAATENINLLFNTSEKNNTDESNKNTYYLDS